MNRDLRSYNRELIRSIADELGIPEEKVPQLVSKIAELVKPQVGDFVGRRTLLAAGIGGLLSIAAASPAAARLTLTDSYIDLDGEKFYPSSVAPYSAIVYKDDNIVKAEDWRGKEIARGEAGVDDAEVIQSALDSLTVGRTWKETVVLKGNFTLDTIIQLENVDIKIIGKIINSKDGAHFQAGNNVVVKGGEINSTNGGHILKVQGDDVIIEGVRGYGTTTVDRTGIQVTNSNRVQVINCHISGSKKANISVSNSYDIAILGNITHDNIDDYGIYVEYSERVIIKDNTSYSNGRDGIQIKGSCKNIQIIGNICYDHPYDGIDIHARYPEDTADDIKDIIVARNMIFSNSNYGIHAYDVSNIKIVGNILRGNGKGIGVGKSSDIQNDVYNILIAKNMILETQGEGFLFSKYPNIYGLYIINNYIYKCTGDTGTGIAFPSDHDLGLTLIKGNWIAENDQHGIYMPNQTNKIIRGNVIIGNGNWGAYTSGSADYLYFLYNYFKDNANGNLRLIGANSKAIGNIGYLTENSGTATFSGDGSTTQFSIAHGLVSTPSKVQVTPLSADAAGDFYVTADDTYIYINYSTAPPSGTDNVKVSWYAEV